MRGTRTRSSPGCSRSSRTPGCSRGVGGQRDTHPSTAALPNPVPGAGAWDERPCRYIWRRQQPECRDEQRDISDHGQPCRANSRPRACATKRTGSGKAGRHHRVDAEHGGKPRPRTKRCTNPGRMTLGTFHTSAIACSACCVTLSEPQIKPASPTASPTIEPR